ncbi:hypothetical protein RI129_012443 [Pyrocoelia pectoralis]|uniref:F-box domain-containing protein n=1 Tax=Pyrocoelia pectoralis TaxID=417401 RepID=A0AAN7V242_9COLE
MDTTMFSGTSSLKRKCKSPAKEKSQLKRRVIEEPPGPSINILDFSDCILLEILKHLDATSLFQLSLTCQRFSCLVEDQSLWIHIDGRAVPNTLDKTEFCWRHATEKTKRLLLAGTLRSQFILSPNNIFSPEKLSNLTILSLEHQYIKYCKLSDFPRSIEELSFRHAFIARHLDFFRFSEKTMCNLKTLLLDHCQWFDSNNLTPLCKYPKLEILSLYMCKKLGNDDIANVSIASRFGFNTLKVLDVRFTGVGDHFLESFSSKANIQIIYFQCITTTYYLERYQRQLDIINGTKTADENSYISDDESHENSPESLKTRFNACNLQKYDTQSITNSSITSLSKLEPIAKTRTRPKSVLYKYPYNGCTCHNKDKEKPDLLGENTERHQLRTKLEEEQKKQTHTRKNMLRNNLCFFFPNISNACSEIVYDSCFIPTWCHREALPDSPLQHWLYAREPKNDFEISMYENADKYLHSHITHRCVNEECMCENRFLLSDNIITPQELLNDAICMLTDVIIQLKKCCNAKMTAKDLTHKFLTELFKYFNMQGHELLQDDTFIEEISSNLYELSVKITYDVTCVMKYHTTCFIMLLNAIKRNKNLDQNLKTFFLNLLLSESTGSIVLTEDINFERSPVVKESVRPETAIHGTFRSIDNDSSRVLIVNLPPNIGEVQEFPTQFVCISRRGEPNKKYPSRIKEISFRGCILITDVALKHLRHLELDLLDITGTNITQKAVEEFMTYNPRCWVIHESVCVCRPNLHF